MNIGKLPLPPLKGYVENLGVTLVQRGSEHGNFQEFLNITAELWGVAFRRNFSRTDVALALVLVKAARVMNSPTSHGKPDDWLDMGGYAAAGWQASPDSAHEWGEHA